MPTTALREIVAMQRSNVVRKDFEDRYPAVPSYTRRTRRSPGLT